VRLHGETPGDARERHRHFLQLALSCIHATAYLYFARPPLATDPDLWVLDSNPSPIPLDRWEGEPIYLTVTQSLRMRRHKRQWRMSTQQYIYNVAEGSDTRTYLFAWHWHPALGRSECHLHARAELSNGTRLDKKHIPTARISLEEVLRFLISECDVVPAKDETEWRKLLDESQKRHEQYRSWWGSRKPGR
jgi:hypothetical protein